MHEGSGFPTQQEQVEQRVILCNLYLPDKLRELEIQYSHMRLSIDPRFCVDWCTVILPLQTRYDG